MRRTMNLVALLICWTVSSGCGLIEGEETIADRLDGTWEPSLIADPSGNRTSEFLDLMDEFSFRFRANESFTIFADYNQAGEDSGYVDAGYDGTFTTEVTTTNWLTFMFADEPDFRVNWNFSNENTFDFSGQASEFNALFGGPTMTGVFEIRLRRQAVQ